MLLPLLLPLPLLLLTSAGVLTPPLLIPRDTLQPLLLLLLLILGGCCRCYSLMLLLPLLNPGATLMLPQPAGHHYSQSRRMLPPTSRASKLLPLLLPLLPGLLLQPAG